MTNKLLTLLDKPNPPSPSTRLSPFAPTPMHPDIEAEMTKIPFVPLKITHNSTVEAEMEAAAEIIHGNACLLYDQLRKTRQSPATVATLINATRGLLHLRRKYLKAEDDSDSTPRKPKVISLG